EVAEQQPHPDQPLEQVLDQAVVDARRGDARDEERQQEEEPDAEDRRDREHQGDGPPAELEPLAAGLEVRAADEPAGADDQRLVQDDQPADERPLRPGLGVEPGVEALGGPDDLTVGVSERDRDRIATAHQDAFHERLAAIGVSGHARKSTGRPGIETAGPGARRRFVSGWWTRWD